jgi:NifU-like protein involved in Fe-S cluster formation
MASAAALYTPQMLALATGLAAWPLDEALPLQGSARSKSCGSTLALGLATDAQGRIARIGMRAQACAIGQAAAAIFAEGAIGRNAGDIGTASAELAAWLAGTAPRPSWPRLDLLEPARAYPARHGAIMLAWQAARDLLPTSALPR